MLQTEHDIQLFYLNHDYKGAPSIQFHLEEEKRTSVVASHITFQKLAQSYSSSSSTQLQELTPLVKSLLKIHLHGNNFKATMSSQHRCRRRMRHDINTRTKFVFKNQSVVTNHSVQNKTPAISHPKNQHLL